MGNQANQNDTVTCADPDATNYGAEGSCTYSSGEGEGSGGGGKPRYSPNPSDPPQCPTLATPDCEIIAYGNYTDAQLYFLAQQMFKAGIGVAIIMTIVAAFVAGPCPYCTIAIEIWAIGEAAILSEASSYFSDAANSGAETCMRDCRTGVILYDDSGAGGYGHLSYDGGIPSMPLFGPIGVWAIKNNMISAWGYNGDGSR